MLFIKYFANPKSCTIIASIPNSYALAAIATASSNSESLIKVFKVKLVFTFLSFA